MKFILCWILIFINTASGSEGNLELCIGAAKNFGSQKGNPIKIPAFCADLIKENTNSYQRETLGEYSAYGVANLILIENKNSFFIGGDKTYLQNIIAIRINEQENLLHVLNERDGNAEILAFDIRVAGNNVPKRRLVNLELNSATNFRIIDQELVVLSSSENWIKIFKLSADVEGRAAKNSTELVRQIKNPLIGAPKDFLSFDDKIYILDNDSLLKAKSSNLSNIVEMSNSNSSVLIIEDELVRKVAE